MRFRSLCLVMVLLASPFAAQAQPFQGLYIGAGAGVYWPESINVQAAVLGSSRTQLDPSVGFAGLASVGYALGNGFRFELEGNYRTADISRGTGPGLSTFSGTAQTYGALANVLFDMDVHLPWLYPYVGGGVGYGWTHLRNLAVTPVAGSPTGVITSNDTAGGLAYQAIAGLSFPMPRVPGLSLTAEYRFFGIAGGRTFAATVTPPGGPFQVKLQQQFSNDFLFGVRYAFNVAQPVPVPTPAAEAAPAPAPARSYLVFFDWDKATLSDRARQIVKEAADNSTHVQYTRIEVNGYTDTSGTPKYNQGLSLRRARAVQVELIKDGVPQNAITIQGFGDTHLLVQTGPGVREPQNRRVEIIIR
jgi:OmpA-OmpF porin, OOP family